MTHNRLANEPSPYLLQHKDNPVHWYPWGDEAFDTAKETGKPVLLSIGYAACHWCHVMAHESFEDLATAELMNGLFINVKLDREERPDIDKIYMEALHHLGEQGGWPLTIFLNAERQPIWGGTYFPKEAQYGRPSFQDVLKQISSIYQTAPEKAKTNTDALQAALLQQPRTASATNLPELSLKLIDQVATQIHSIVDPVRGGLQGAPKFPQVPIFQLLWRHYLRTGDTTSRNHTLVTLRNICQGGIYDHLGGGFARYSVDVKWLAPHFEKMLYDNAQLIDLLTSVWQHTKDDLFRNRIEETIEWLTREMIAEHGAFAASLDADSDGEEGTFYVWQKNEIEDALEEHIAQFCEIYDVASSGNWEGKIILNRLSAMDIEDPQLEAILKQQRKKLFLYRNKRNPPARDDKILTDWNGLMIAAVANSGSVFANKQWIKLAGTAYAGVKRALYKDHAFLQSHRAGQTRHPATADGYANMIRAALSLLEATQHQNYLEDAKLWVTKLTELFWNEERGGYYYTGSHATDLIRRTYSASDDATPNANATMISNLSRLYAATGDETYRKLGDQTVQAFTSLVLASGIAHAGALNGIEDFIDLVQMVIVGDPAAPNYDSMKQALLERSIPNHLLLCVTPGKDLPKSHPASGKSTNARVTVYLCKGNTCSLPVTDLNGIDQAFDRL
ncbi:MAG: thioredoxin domain-containing protein [Rhodobacteraceae bacterium]|nr:thioredoxin domain-containing protein [Paracoccaceae bacterium]